MKLTKAQRATLREMFDGRCAYCGEPLAERGWHADHVERVERKLKRLPSGVVVTTSEVHRPERDTIENLMPSCAPCNIDKHFYSIEEWRALLQARCGVLHYSQSTYRSMLRFGQIVETPTPIVFYFERVAHAKKESERDLDEQIFRDIQQKGLIR